MNIQLTRKMLERDERWATASLGDIYKNTKNTSQGSGFNARKFILLGDPAMRIGLPERIQKLPASTTSTSPRIPTVQFKYALSTP